MNRYLWLIAVSAALSLAGCGREENEPVAVPNGDIDANGVDDPTTLPGRTDQLDDDTRQSDETTTPPRDATGQPDDSSSQPDNQGRQTPLQDPDVKEVEP